MDRGSASLNVAGASPIAPHRGVSCRPPAGGAARRLAVAVVLAAVLLPGCQDDEGVLLTVRTTMAVPDEIDALTVDVWVYGVSSEVFGPERKEFPLEVPGRLPIRVAVRPQEVFNAWVSLRVQGWLGTRLVAFEWSSARFAPGEIVEIEVVLEFGEGF